MQWNTVLLFIVVIIAKEIPQANAVGVKITNGIIFRRLDGDITPYRNSIPILYREQFDIDEDKIEEMTNVAFYIEKETECKKKNIKTCDKSVFEDCMKKGFRYGECTKIMQKLEHCGNDCTRLESYANLTKNVQDLINKEMNAAIFEMMVEIGQIRKKEESKF